MLDQTGAINGLSKTTSGLLRSPVFTSWMALSTRLGGSILLLWFVTVELTAAEIAVWLVFNAINTLQTVFDFGFNPTYVRLMSRAHAHSGGDRQASAQAYDGASHLTFGQLAAAARWTYDRISGSAALLLLSFGSLAIHGITLHADAATKDSTWLAWPMQMTALCLTLLHNKYIVALHGSGDIAKHRACEALVALGSLIASVIVIASGGGLVALSAISLASSALALVVYRRASTSILVATGAREIASDLRTVRTAVWSSAWRSGVGIACSLGITQVILVAFATTLVATEAARYLLAMQVMQVLSALAQPPFYSKIPQFVQLYAQGRHAELAEMARHAMRASHWVFTLGAVVTGVAAGPLLSWVDSKAQFPAPIFWFTLAVASFIERFSAMHLQLFTITNRVMWHITNSITGVAIAVLTPLLVTAHGPLGLPLAILIAYGAFQSWYCAQISYRTLAVRPWQFERSSALPPAIVLAGAWLATILLVQQ